MDRRGKLALSFCVLALAGFLLWKFFYSEPPKGFESGDFAGWNLRRLARPDAAQIVKEPVRHGRFAASVSLYPGGTSLKELKSELSENFNAPFRKEIWYRVSHYLPSDFMVPENNGCVLAQWHNVSPKGVPGGKPPLAHRYRDGVFYVTAEFTLQPLKQVEDAQRVPLYRIENFPKNQWHDFVYRIVWSADSEGAVDLWHNGKLVASYHGPIGYPGDPDGHYFKMGVYCAKAPGKTLTAYFDEYRRGYDRDGVLLPGEKLQ